MVLEVEHAISVAVQRLTLFELLAVFLFFEGRVGRNVHCRLEDNAVLSQSWPIDEQLWVNAERRFNVLENFLVELAGNLKHGRLH